MSKNGNCGPPPEDILSNRLHFLIKIIKNYIQHTDTSMEINWGHVGW